MHLTQIKLLKKVLKKVNLLKKSTLKSKITQKSCSKNYSTKKSFKKGPIKEILKVDLLKKVILEKVDKSHKVYNFTKY